MGEAMISPAGLVVRNDPWGKGYFHASRDEGKRLHSGVDIAVSLGERIVAPEDCLIIRTGIVYPDAPHYNLIVLQGQFFMHKIMYVHSHLSAGSIVKSGVHIGYPQDISARYDDRMIPHIHWEVSVNGFSKAGGPYRIFVDPSKAMRL